MAIKDKSTLLNEAVVIRDETTLYANTPLRVGQHLYDVIDSVEDRIDAKADPLGADENTVTDAQLVIIQNTSGTNTGDQDASTTDYDASAETGGNLSNMVDNLQDAVEGVRNFVNEPMADLPTLSVPVTIDKTGTFPDLTLSSNLNITFAESGHKKGNAKTILITTAGSYTLTFTKPDAYNLYNFTDLTNGATLAAGSYQFTFAFIGGSIKIFYQEAFSIDAIPALNQVTGLTAAADSSTQITLDWTDTNTSPNEASYLIEIDTVNTFDSVNYVTTTAAADAETKAITGLDENTLYYFRITAEGDDVTCSDSIPSAIVSEPTDEGDLVAPTLSNFRIEEANPARVLFDSSEVITGTTYGGFTIASPSKAISGITINAGNTTGHYFTVSVAFVSGDNPTIAYSGTGSDIEDTLSNALQAFSAVSITNNISIIVMEDDFAGTTIDTGKWTITDPADGVTISQNDELIFTVSGAVASSNTNRVDSVATVTTGTLQVDLNTLSASSLVLVLRSSSGKQAYIVMDGVTNTIYYRVFNSTVVFEYSESLDPSNTSVKIEQIGTDIKFFMSNGSAWVQKGTTYSLDLGGTLSARLGAASVSGDIGLTNAIGQVYLTNAAYTTLIPT